MRDMSVILYLNYCLITADLAPGHALITDHCSICEHRPMSQDLCKPNKALRNTAKAYLKTAEKKLADEKAKAEVVDAPTPAAPTQKPVARAPVESPVHPNVGETPAVEEVAVVGDVKVEESVPSGGQHPLADQPQPSIEVSLAPRAARWL